MVRSCGALHKGNCKANGEGRSDGQLFTAPAVSPLMICRAATKVKISGGMAIRLPMTITRPQSTPMSVMNSEAATGRVRVWRSVNTKAKMNSLQAIRNVKMAAAAKPGAIMGNSTLVKMRSGHFFDVAVAAVSS